jgi:oxygen-independent coproporphyrinogen-3 oxidase
MSPVAPIRFHPAMPAATCAPAAPPPLGLYIHFPWCVRKCPYCDFNSHPLHGDLPESDYLAALSRDLESALPQVWGRPVETVFIGGGTPSLLSGQGLDRLLTRLRTLLPLRPWAEITLEANPGTFEVARFEAYREAGVNRLSLGVQSFDRGHLRALGRIHDEREAQAAAEAALAIFEQVNLDLMYALPGQTLGQARRDLETALALGPAHVSAYHLTLEPNTAFAAAPPPLPDDDLAADMQEMVEATLAGAGYAHYETSAYARPGRQCRHNLNYWQFGDYLGIGAGAHGKLSFHDRIVRQARVRHPRDYLRQAGAMAALAEDRVVPTADLPFEFMMNALRLADGFVPSLYEAHTGQPLLSIEPTLQHAEQAGLIERSVERIRPTARGRRYLNDLVGMFLP